MTADAAESRAVRGVVALLTIVVCAAVVVAMQVGQGSSSSSASGLVPTTLASVNACLNAASAVALVAGFAFIRAGRRDAHRASMLTAFVLSSLFLVGYLLHHSQVGSVRFTGTGWARSVYYAILIPHVVLAAAVVPLALFTLYRGLTGRLQAHRRIARVTLPIWLYVSVSGVLVYLMLYR